ncbi:MAG: DUF488 family protein [Actinomycetota bacterium]
MAKIHTIGHGTRTLEELKDILGAAEVGTLVDVRRFPGSRRHPHFASAPLAEALERAGISYKWWGEELGGRRSASREPDDVRLGAQGRRLSQLCGPHGHRRVPRGARGTRGAGS